MDLNIVILVVVGLNLAVSIFDLVIDLRSIPAKSANVREQAADAGIALAERMSRLNRGPKGERLLTSIDKMKIAVEHAVDHCDCVRVETTAAQMRKLVEVRLEQAQPKKP